MSSPFPRLIYLAAETRPQIPRRLLRYIPQGNVLEAVTKSGIGGAAVELDLPPEQLDHLYSMGRSVEPASVSEFWTLFADLALQEIELRRSELALSDYLAVIGELDAILRRKNEPDLIAREEVDLSTAKVTDVPKFTTGFTPLDQVTGGFYQGIALLISPPGGGKTTSLLGLMAELRRTNSASSIWYFEIELPMPIMTAKISPTLSRVKYLPPPADRLICGFHTSKEILAMVEAEPDPDRVIIVDSPDVMAGGTGDKMRAALEEIYLDFIRLKQKCKLVVATSWPRRRDQVITLTSASESAAKERYSDLVIAWYKLGMKEDGWNSVRAHVLKNRLGIADQDLIFDFNYSTLQWRFDDQSMAREGNDW